MKVSCPALMITAPGSGHGKTSITAALARYFSRRKLRVRCFKVGPDFIDPTLLMRASAQPVYNLDPWIMGVEHCRELLFDAAQNSDLILVEGVMGLYDGNPSSADLAALFDIPIVPVIDASAMAQTFGAVVHGLATYRAGLRLAGAVANRVASDGHAQMLAASLPQATAFSAVKRSEAVLLPERHLGLQLAAEITDIDARLDALADLLEGSALTAMPSPVDFELASVPRIKPSLTGLTGLTGLTVAVASDQAFCFLYRANLEWLQKLGATLHLFSPLADTELPDVDAIYLPGGYPELHAATLAANRGMRDAITTHVAQNKPVLAECGGMLYLAESLSDLEGNRHDMLGVLPGDVTMNRKLTALGSQQIIVGNGVGVGDGVSDVNRNGSDDVVRGHTFHYSSFNTRLEPLTHAVTSDGRRGEAVYRQGSVLASYLHWYFPSNPQRIATWLRGGL